MKRYSNIELIGFLKQTWIDKTFKFLPRHKIDKYLHKKIFLYIVALFTIFCLFFDDLRLAILNKNSDSVFFVFKLISFLFFLIELTMWIVAKQHDYLKSMYFVFDLLSLIEIIFGLGWVYRELFGTVQSPYSEISLATRIYQ